MLQSYLAQSVKKFKTFLKDILFKNSNLFIKTDILNLSVIVERVIVLDRYLFLSSSGLVKSNFKL